YADGRWRHGWPPLAGGDFMAHAGLFIFLTLPCSRRPPAAPRLSRTPPRRWRDRGWPRPRSPASEAAERVALLRRLMPSRITEKGRGHPSSAWPNGLWPEGTAPSTHFEPANRVDSTPDRALRDSRGLARRRAARRGRQGRRWRSGPPRAGGSSCPAA